MLSIVPVNDMFKHKPETLLKHVKDVKKAARFIVYLDEFGNITEIVDKPENPLNIIVFLAPIPFNNKKTTQWFILFEIGFGKQRPYFCAPNHKGRYQKGFSRITGRIKLYTLDKKYFLDILPTLTKLMREAVDFRTKDWKHKSSYEVKVNYFYAWKRKPRIDFRDRVKIISSGIVCSVSKKDTELIEIFKDLGVYSNFHHQRLIRQIALGINYSLAGYGRPNKRLRFLKGCQNVITLLSRHEDFFKQRSVIERILLEELIAKPDLFIDTLHDFGWITLRESLDFLRILPKQNKKSKTLREQYIIRLLEQSNGLQIRTRYVGNTPKHQNFEVYPTPIDINQNGQQELNLPDQSNGNCLSDVPF